MMNKILIISILCLLSISLFAQQQVPVQIKGELKYKADNIRLFKVSEGRIVEIASSAVTKNGQFGFLFFPDYEGIYVLGTGNENRQRSNFKFYFKEGDQLDVTLTDTAYVLNGKLNSKENIVMKQWADLTYPLFRKSIYFMEVYSTYVDYFPQQEAIIAKSKTFLNGKTTSNSKFDKEIKTIMQMDLINYAVFFVSSSARAVHPKVEEYSDFYATLKTKELSATTQKIYNYPYGQQVLSSLVWMNMEQDKVGGSGIDKMLEYVSNDTLKGDIVIEFLSQYEDYKNYKVVIDKFGKYLLTKTQKEKNISLIVPLLSYEKGSDALAFSYPDKDGNEVSFASLKGNVVLIDVWATWCGPCKAEFPYLKQLEKDIAGKPIRVVSISIDEDGARNKWLKMIRDEGLGGIQLFGGSNEEFSDYYKINAIPRFLVFDKNGKIVTVDAPRPSDPKLKELLFSEAAK
ncbi:Thiol-disulfide oxidoreductase resA [Sphingobacterium spiritivorum]|uniref:Thiol-disulfide oxidoreductase resA n=1 Tax=Sphingobacterium spiritivorum TaxID=258 RepID=A0A380BL92_SPHSI|nr:TlpA disulfide reductase family protein [Sphingobacterium spiritivorum]SUJ02707.1 Thiol-disulfide oxidoreductase resA [Sphingobacterium spiritivorum]